MKPMKPTKSKVSKPSLGDESPSPAHNAKGATSSPQTHAFMEKGKDKERQKVKIQKSKNLRNSGTKPKTQDDSSGNEQKQPYDFLKRKKVVQGQVLKPLPGKNNSHRSPLSRSVSPVTGVKDLLHHKNKQAQKPATLSKRPEAQSTPEEEERWAVDNPIKEADAIYEEDRVPREKKFMINKKRKRDHAKDVDGTRQTSQTQAEEDGPEAKETKDSLDRVSTNAKKNALGKKVGSREDVVDDTPIKKKASEEDLDTNMTDAMDPATKMNEEARVYDQLGIESSDMSDDPAKPSQKKAKTMQRDDAEGEELAYPDESDEINEDGLEDKAEPDDEGEAFNDDMPDEVPSDPTNPPKGKISKVPKELPGGDEHGSAAEDDEAIVNIGLDEPESGDADEEQNTDHKKPLKIFKKELAETLSLHVESDSEEQQEHEAEEPESIALRRDKLLKGEAISTKDIKIEIRAIDALMMECRRRHSVFVLDDKTKEAIGAAAADMERDKLTEGVITGIKVGAVVVFGVVAIAALVLAFLQTGDLTILTEATQASVEGGLEVAQEVAEAVSEHRENRSEHHEKKVSDPKLIKEGKEAMKKLSGKKGGTEDAAVGMEGKKVEAADGNVAQKKGAKMSAAEKYKGWGKSVLNRQPGSMHLDHEEAKEGPEAEAQEERNLRVIEKFKILAALNIKEMNDRKAMSGKTRE
ncbi:uncharacterized protein KY384_009273 [Bacidia gigantensis]|uniref:uncharacterized protein n=1 Tax=Bacidia gigantensis TaxID=2732470 RepID=UPI001D04D441|nr:uncharacterized protein KY384_009273 [Bacidia gigantensis]KAG8525629.1 hypothetical protein KY384_009273 [Bacidia gigantensis]